MIEVFDFPQNSPEWSEARRGLVTASQITAVMSNGRGSKPSVTRRKYLLQLVADRLGAEPPETYSNSHMERGHLLEQEAADLYSFMRKTEVQPVGFIRNGETGCSPDRMIGTRGLLEVKTKLPYLLLECLLSGEFPDEFVKQCQAQLWISQREFVDLMVYWPGLRPLIVRAERNEKLIATMQSAVDDFLGELHQIVDQLQRAA